MGASVERRQQEQAAIVEEVRAIATARGASPAQVALAWLGRPRRRRGAGS